MEVDRDEFSIAQRSERNVVSTYGLDDGRLDHVGRNGDSSGGHDDSEFFGTMYICL